jgi:TolC family type I secretion outer membrane protein
VTRGVNLSVRQSLYAGGGIQADVRRAENTVRAERAFLLATEQQVLFDVVDAYTATWRDRAVLELAITSEERIRRQLQATRDRFEVGEVARTDVAQAEARLARAQADVESARADLAASTAFYRDVIGYEPGILADPEAFPDLPATQAEAQALAAANPSITSATFNLQAARESVDVAFADLLPSLDLTGNYRYQQQESRAIDRRDEARVGLELSVPLFQGGADRSRVRQTRELVDARRSELEDTLRGVQRSVSTSWERIIAAVAAIEALEEEVRANGIALDGVQEEALVGQRTVLDVLDAEQELFNSQTNLVRARREWIVATYQLKSAVGELTVAGLDLPVQPFDDTTNYFVQRERLFGLD